MKLFGKLWKVQSALLISLALVLSGCGGGGSSDSASNGGNSDTIPDSVPNNGGNNGSNGGNNNSGGSGSVVDNSNSGSNNGLPETGNVEVFVNLDNAIDDLALLDAGGVKTFGKKSKEKSYKGQAKDISNLWAVQYKSTGELERVIPMTKSGSRFIFSSDLTNSRDYKFVFLGYENQRWTGDVDEVYTGPTVSTTTIGASGPADALNGHTGGTSFLLTSTAAASKASLSGVANGVKVVAKDAGVKGNNIRVKMEEGARATYYVGTINNGNGGPMVQYRTVAGTKGNVSIRFQYHDEFATYITGSIGTPPAGTGLTVANMTDYGSQIYLWDEAANMAEPRDQSRHTELNGDSKIQEYVEYNVSTNTITVHYGGSTSAHTVALLLQTQSYAIDTADIVIAGALGYNPTITDAENEILNNLALDDSLLNNNNGDLNASGNTNAEVAKVEYNAGTSLVTIKYQTTEADFNGASATFPLALAGNRPTSQGAGNIVSTVGDIMQAYQDAAQAVRNLVDFELTGNTGSLATISHATATNLSGGADASGHSAVTNFDKNSNPVFVWKDALSLFAPESLFSAYAKGLKTGASITPHNPVGFNNLYKNFTYFGILHLKGSDITSKKAKTTVEAKVVSSQAYRVEGNIGPAVYKIENDSFTLGAPTGEIILSIRNYFRSDISLEDLRITTSIQNSNLDADSGRVSVALPVPAAPWVFDKSGSTGFAAAVVNNSGAALIANPVTLAAPWTLGGNLETNVFHSSASLTETPLFPSGDASKQDFTITKKSRTSFVRDFVWENAIISVGGVDTPVTSQAAQTDVVLFDIDADNTVDLDKGIDYSSSFVTRTATEGGYIANDAGEFLDLIYHLYYRPRSSVGTDFINVFIEDGSRDPAGNLEGPRDSVLPTLAQRIAATRSPSIALDGTILAYDKSDKDLIYNTLSLQIPVDTVVLDVTGQTEEPDALVSFAIAFDNSSNTSDNDPSTMNVRADLTNAVAGETYTYRWSWSKYMELDGDNPMIGMPAGAVLHGNGLHELIFTDATGAHPQFTSVKVTVRPSAGLDPEGTLRPFDPSTFNPTQSPVLVENVDRDFVFYQNYDAGNDALSMVGANLKAAVKLDIATDPSEAHLIVTPRTNSAGEMLASGAEIAEAIRYYLLNAPKMISLKSQNPSFALLSVDGKGSQLDDVPFYGAVRAGEAGGKVLGNARTPDDNAGSSLDLRFANSTEYEKVRNTGSPVLSVHILDTVPAHNGSVFIVNLSNAYPPVVDDPIGTISSITYTLMNLSTDGVTTNPANQEIFLSVANDTDADGAVTFNIRVKRDNGGLNDTENMQHKNTVIDGSPLGALATRENQFVGYWEVRRVSNQAVNVLAPVGSDKTNFWVLGDVVDFVGSGADGDLDGVDLINVIPSDARKFNPAPSADAGEHSAVLSSDPDDPTNKNLEHLLFSCRLILPTAASARDSYFVTFRFRPGVDGADGAPPIMTKSYIITVTE